MNRFFFRKRGVATTANTQVYFQLRKASGNDFATGSDWTPAAGDVKIAKDGNATANVATLPTYTNGSWRLSLSASEMDAATILITIADAPTKAIQDAYFGVETFGATDALFRQDFAATGVNLTTVVGESLSVTAGRTFSYLYNNGGNETDLSLDDITSIHGKTSLLNFTAGTINANVPGNVTVGGYASNQDPFTIIKNGTFDGISSERLFTALLALINGQATVVDDGNNIETWTFKKRNGTTMAFTVIRNKITSERTATGDINS